ncbi:MAG: hypothetical protein JO157_07915, partial [Acetobacteraceae bacterium]|nr:hypothetical protein [Acetobacteraceae bacterium]
MGELASRAWEGAFGPDPGRLRLRSAGRVLCAVTVTLVALLLLGRVTAMPIGAVALGFMISLFGGTAVRDPSPRQQRVTLLLTPLPALAASMLATLLSPWLAVADLGFLAVVFGATAVRGFGPRWVALGMLAYIAYFLGEVLHPPLAELPAEAVALAVATASGLLVRFVLVPERPASVLRRAVRDVERRIGRILGHAEAILTRGACGETERRGLARQVTRLKEAALVAEDQIEALNGDRLKPAAERSRLGSRLFELELAGERVAWLACAAAERGDEAATERRRLAALGEVLRTGRRPDVASSGGGR